MSEVEDNINANVPDLKDFKLEQILSNDAARKKIIVLGSFNQDPAKIIIIMEKTEFAEAAFTTDDENKAFLKHISTVRQMNNDIYSDFVGTIDPSLNSLKLSTIYPATENHIKKYSRQDFFTFYETPEMYQTITLPHLSLQKFSLDWVYNILEGKKEADRVDFKDEDPQHGFLLTKDLKWNGQVESLHLTAIVFDRNIKSLRDLNASHLPLLENIRKNSFATIKAKYGLDETKIRAYLHYQPSYYHLHVHFTNLAYDAPGIHCDRGHLLSTVINNIQLMSDYYQKATIPFVTGNGFGLYNAIMAAQTPVDDGDKAE